MIAKRLKQDKKFSKDTSRHIRDLSDYILDAKSQMRNGEAQTEKVLCTGSMGFSFEGRDAQIAEMCALAARCPRSQQPTNHYVLSWRPEEHPTPEQVKEAVNIFVDETGLKGHQVIWGAHQNTDCIHVHIQINRVSPETEKICKINNGFDKIMCQQAVAKIEHAQHLQPCEHALFKVSEDGKLERNNNAQRITISEGARQSEQRTGEMSAERRAKLLLPELEKARSWQELHWTLKQHNAFYNLRAGGAVIRFGDTKEHVKASKVARELSKKHLEERFGFYKKPDRFVKDYTPENAAKNNNIIELLILLILKLFGMQLVKRIEQKEHHTEQRKELEHSIKDLNKEVKEIILEVQREEQKAQKHELLQTQQNEIKEVKSMTAQEQQRLFEMIDAPAPVPAQQHQRQGQSQDMEM